MKCPIAVQVIALTFLWLAQLAVSAGEPVASDRRLPSDVTAYVTIPSVSELKARWQNTSFGHLIADQSLGGFLRDLEEAIKPVSKELQAELGVTLDDLLSIPNGELSIAVLQPAGGKPSLVGLLDYGDRVETVESLLDRAERAAKDQNIARTVRELDGTDAIVYSLPAKQDDSGAGTAPNNTLAFFRKDSTIVVSNDVETLELVLDRWHGDRGRSLAENDMYRYIADRCTKDETDPVLRWYVEPVRLVQGLLTGFGESDPQTLARSQMVLATLPMLGLNKIKAMGGTIDIATENFDTISQALLYVELPASGLLNAFKFPAIPQAPPRWIPSGASIYFAVNWDITSAWNAVESVVDSFRGPGWLAGKIEELASPEGATGFHIKKDLIDHLSGQIHVMTDMAVPDDAGSQRGLVAIGLRDPEASKSVVERVTRMPGFPGSRREFLGQVLYDWPMGPAAHGGAKAMGMAVTKGHLIIATDVTLLESIMRDDPDRKSLAEMPDYRAVARHLPDSTSGLSFQRQDSQVRAAYELLRSGAASKEIPKVDFTKLPPFSVIQKYLRPSGSYAVPDRNGVLFVSFTLPGKGGTPE